VAGAPKVRGVLAQHPLVDHAEVAGVGGGRTSIIETVQTPLGFFVLVVLVVEVILGVVTTAALKPT